MNQFSGFACGDKGLCSPFQRCTVTWLEDWREFFHVSDLIPDAHQDLPEQFNCLSRILIFLILGIYLAYGFNRYVFILLILMLGMILSYLVLVKGVPTCPVMETYNPPPLQRTPLYASDNNFWQQPIINYDSKLPEIPIVISGTNSNPSLIDVQQSGTWCKPNEVLGDAAASVNQNLVGGANPKTRVIPVIPPPIYDGETWLPNDFVVPFKINDQRRQELQQNGYMTWEDNLPAPCSTSTLNDLLQTYGCVPQPPQQQQPHPQQQPHQPEMREDYRSDTYGNANYGQGTPRAARIDESMDITSGYFPDNSQYNYPVNSAPFPCMRSPSMVDYNKNLYSVPLQPNVYTRSQVNQPDASMSNLGISFTQPHLPYKCEMDDRGNMVIDQYDPNQYPSEYLLRGRDRFAQDSDMIPRNEIYDPRLTGYGTSYRGYVDPMMGQPRFYYDDVDTHTQQNFISRNKIDFTNFGPTTEPYSHMPPMNTRHLADQTFHNDQMKQRTELQYRLMTKNSAREWQRRAAPIQTQGFGPAGCGMASASSYAGPRG